MRRPSTSEPHGRRRRVVGAVVVLVIVVAGGRGGVLRGHDLREPRRGGARRHVLRAAHVGDARGGGGGGGGGGTVVRGGDAARGGGARAAAAPLPPVDGAPGTETVHDGGSPVGSGPPGRPWRGDDEAEGSGREVGESTERRRWSFQFFAFLQFAPRTLLNFSFVRLG